MPFLDFPSRSTTIATNLASGGANQIPYQTGANATGFIASGASKVLVTDASSVPSLSATLPDVTVGQVTFADAQNCVLNATTGTKWGTAVGQKQAWWNATPVAQGAAVADAAGGATVDAEARTAINTLLARMRTYGLIAT